MRRPGEPRRGTDTRRRHTARSGAALLEAIVALVVLATAGLAAVTVTTQAASVAERAREAEARVRRASAFLEAVSLWTREDLDRHLGDRPQGPYRLIVEHPHAVLYTAQLRDSTGKELLVATSLYRAEARLHAMP